MRDIKFRAWNENEKKMVNPCMWVNECNLITTQMCSAPTHPIMQFTGLKDREGTDIYEGDILSHDKNYKPYICVMEWHNGLGSCGCCFDQCESIGFVGRVIEWSNYDYSVFASDYNEMLIIGNIHETPEPLSNG